MQLWHYLVLGASVGSLLIVVGIVLVEERRRRRERYERQMTAMLKAWAEGRNPAIDFAKITKAPGRPFIFPRKEDDHGS